MRSPHWPYRLAVIMRAGSKHNRLGVVQRKNIPKNRDYYGSGWVGPGLTGNFFFGKSSQNINKPPTYIYFGDSSSIVVSYYDLSMLVHVRDGFQKKVWMEGGWVV